MKKSKTSIYGALAILVGILCIVIKALSYEYIDANNVLQEAFYLLPIGVLFIFFGGLAVGFGIVKNAYLKVKSKGIVKIERKK